MQSPSLLIIFLLGIALLLVVLLIVLTKRSDTISSTPIVIPEDINKIGSIISFVLKIGLERPRAMAILSLVMVILTISSVAALDAFTQHIRATKPVAVDILTKVDTLDKKLNALSINVNEMKERSLMFVDKTRVLKSFGNEHEPVAKFLNKFLYSFEADRASIVEFHTTAEANATFPFLKMSVTQERTRAGISAEFLNSQSIPARELLPYVKELEDAKCFIITLNEKNDTTHYNSFQFFLSERGTEKAMACPLVVPLQAMPIGFLLLEWTDREDFKPIIQDEVKKQVDSVLIPAIYQLIVKQMSAPSELKTATE